MFLVKTKTRAILTTSAVSVASYAAYDKYVTSETRAALSEKASVIANQPMKTTEVPRKVMVYMADSQYAKYTFDCFIKPGTFPSLPYKCLMLVH